MKHRVKTVKGGIVRAMSFFRLAFGHRPAKRHAGKMDRAVRARRKANKLARRQRRVNRMRQRPHTRRSS